MQIDLYFTLLLEVEDFVTGSPKLLFSWLASVVVFRRRRL